MFKWHHNSLLCHWVTYRIAIPDRPGPKSIERMVLSKPCLHYRRLDKQALKLGDAFVTRTSKKATFCLLCPPFTKLQCFFGRITTSLNTNTVLYVMLGTDVGSWVCDELVLECFLCSHTVSPISSTWDLLLCYTRHNSYCCSEQSNYSTSYTLDLASFLGFPVLVSFVPSSLVSWCLLLCTGGLETRLC